MAKGPPFFFSSHAIFVVKAPLEWHEAVILLRKLSREHMVLTLDLIQVFRGDPAAPNIVEMVFYFHVPPSKDNGGEAHFILVRVNRSVNEVVAVEIGSPERAEHAVNQLKELGFKVRLLAFSSKKKGLKSNQDCGYLSAWYLEQFRAAKQRDSDIQWHSLECWQAFPDCPLAPFKSLAHILIHSPSSEIDRLEWLQTLTTPDDCHRKVVPRLIRYVKSIVPEKEKKKKKRKKGFLNDSHCSFILICLCSIYHLSM